MFVFLESLPGTVTNILFLLGLKRMGCGGDLWYVVRFICVQLYRIRLTCYDLVVIAIAWAHLILYGDEATKLAQKEGEEAAAAYEQEKRDIAAGKIPEPPLKPEKKKKTPVRKSKDKKADMEAEAGGEASGAEGDSPSKKRKATPRESISAEKKPRAMSKTPKTEKEAMTLTLAKGVVKVRC